MFTKPFVRYNFSYLRTRYILFLIFLGGTKSTTYMNIEHTYWPTCTMKIPNIQKKCYTYSLFFFRDGKWPLHWPPANIPAKLNIANVALTTWLCGPVTSLAVAAAATTCPLLRVLSVTATAYLFPGAGHSRIFYLDFLPAQLYLANFLSILNLNVVSATSVLNASTPI